MNRLSKALATIILLAPLFAVAQGSGTSGGALVPRSANCANAQFDHYPVKSPVDVKIGLVGLCFFSFGEADCIYDDHIKGKVITDGTVSECMGR